MKISEDIYMHLMNTFIFEISTGLYNSLNSRLELLAVADDDLPVNVGHYIQDLDLEGGKGVMLASIK
jgi:hypothetical protein